MGPYDAGLRVAHKTKGPPVPSWKALLARRAMVCVTALVMSAEVPHLWALRHKPARAVCGGRAALCHMRQAEVPADFLPLQPV